MENKNLGEGRDVLVQISCAVEEREELEAIRRMIRSVMPKAVIAGMGSVIQLVEGGFAKDAVSLTITQFEKSRCTLVELSLDSEEDSVDEAVRMIGAEVAGDSRSVLLLTNAIATDIEKLVLRYKKRIDLPIFGGIATANPGEHSFLISSHRIYTEDAVVAVIFHGEALRVHIDHLFAWDAIGKEFTVTEAEGRRLKRLDGMTIMDVYSRYFGLMEKKDLLSIALAHPLIKRSDDFGEVSRVLLRLDGDDGLYTGSFKVGEKVQIGFGNYKKMVDCLRKTPDKYRDIPTEAIWIDLCLSYAAPGYTDLLNRSLEIFGANPDALHLNVTFGEFGYVNGTNSLLNNVVIKVFLSEDETARFPYRKIDLDLDAKDRLLETLSTLVVTSGQEIMELNHYLEEEVAKRTEELARLNRMLEKKIEQEVRKNREKDKILFHQSKLAAMGEMLHNIAHQWRQPLNIIALVMQDLSLKAKMGTLSTEAILLAEKKINETLNYLSETIDDFRSFASMGEENQGRARFEAGRAIRETLRLVSVLLEDEKVRLQIDLPREEVMVAGRANDLKQVLLNLVYNAIDVFRDRSVENPVIQIGMHVGNMVEIYVRDNGGGIDEKVIHRIFEPNFSTKFHRHGTGVGLYMSRMIVRKRLDGEIVVKNVAEGAKFEIMLPLYGRQSLCRLENGRKR